MIWLLSVESERMQDERLETRKLLCDIPGPPFYVLFVWVWLCVGVCRFPTRMRNRYIYWSLARSLAIFPTDSLGTVGALRKANFAFNVAFEQREAFLMPLNEVIEQKQPALRQFFASISTDPGGAGATAAPVMPWRLNPDDLASIHEFVMSRVGPIADRLGDATNTQTINYKLFDRVTAVVAQYRVYN